MDTNETKALVLMFFITYSIRIGSIFHYCTCLHVCGQAAIQELPAQAQAQPRPPLYDTMSQNTFQTYSSIRRTISVTVSRFRKFHESESDKDSLEYLKISAVIDIALLCRYR